MGRYEGLAGNLFQSGLLHCLPASASAKLYQKTLDIQPLFPVSLLQDVEITPKCNVQRITLSILNVPLS